MVAHMTPEEQDALRKWVAHEKLTGAQAIERLAKKREKRGDEPLEKTSIYRFLRGETHLRAGRETRGRKKGVNAKDIRVLQQTRRRLIKEANNEKSVTWQDVYDEANLPSAPSMRVVQDALRKKGVTFKPPRRKIAISKDDASKRYKVGLAWAKKPVSFWMCINGYYDCKRFPLPLTPKQRAKFKQTRVTGHLRTGAEGVERGFTKPREVHSWIGLPSVNIAAVVAQNRVIMWEVVDGSWNGQKAADVYSGPMLKALRRVWGKKRSYSLVEDGDRKGNQSRKGTQAKRICKIKAKTLPPRTPCWMPLDYSIWRRVVERVVEGSPRGRETKAAFLARLRRCALTLPRSYVAGQIARMKKQVQGVVDAKGYCPKSD